MNFNSYYRPITEPESEQKDLSRSDQNDNFVQILHTLLSKSEFTFGFKIHGDEICIKYAQ